METPEPLPTQAQDETPLELTELLKELQREARLNRKVGRVARFFSVSNLPFFSYMLVHALFRRAHFPFPLPTQLHELVMYFWISWCMIALIPAVTSKWMLRGSRKRLQALLSALGSDIRAIGPLALLLYHGQSEMVAKPALEALKSLLNRLRASDRTLLSDEQMGALLALLDRRKNPRVPRQVEFAILRGLEQIGDRRAIPEVEKLAVQSRDIELKDAAGECLQFLLAHAEERDKAATLLRPSEAVRTTPEVLLRPAASVSETPQEQMLRPVE